MKKTWLVKIASLVICVCSIFEIFSFGVYAKNNSVEVIGKVYAFDEKTEYVISKTKKFAKSTDAQTYGEFLISANIESTSERNGVPSYLVKNGILSITYNYSDKLLKESKKDWYLAEDKCKIIDEVELENKIGYGLILLQTSKDHKNWTDVISKQNAFADTPINTKSIYSASDVELINGCYYRLIVAYEKKHVAETKKIAFVEYNNYEYKRYAEVYEFFAYNTESAAEDKNELKYSLGEKIRTKKFEGYSGEQEIKDTDAHYGWDIGNFFVSGYTSTAKDEKGNAVILKNVGDKVTLWFNLTQNINKLNGNNNLTINADDDWYDQNFETAKTNGGRGTLIIRYTDYENQKQKPVIYTNYLEANASIGADTKVQLCEEGDYEVSLDYEIRNNKLVDKYSHYKIAFTFCVRNGNCMVYPFDCKTKEELTNSSMTENGFYLDFANSRYLDIVVKKEIMKESADGLIEDTRFNKTAKDKEKYIEDGIYTITAKNKYTNQLTVKKIYVGTNSVLKAYMATGLSIEEINNLIKQGAAINDDGTISMFSYTPDVADTPDGNTTNNKQNKNITLLILILVVFVIIVIIIVVGIKKKNSSKKKNKEANNNDSISTEGENKK